MFAVETYAAVRRFVFVEGRSRREAARVFGISRTTIDKMRPQCLQSDLASSRKPLMTCPVNRNRAEGHDCAGVRRVSSSGVVLTRS